MPKLSAAIVTASLLTAACGDASPSTPATRLTTSLVPEPTTVAAVATTDPVATTPTSMGVEPTSTTTTTTVTSLAHELTVTKSIAYSESGLLDVYAPSAPGPWPVAIVVHGIFQSRGGFADLSEAIAAQGTVVYNIQVGMSPPFFTAIGQIGCAVRYARHTAADYGGDPSRITLVGNSSGGHTGAVVAMAGDSFEGVCVVTEGSAEIDALVGYEGVFDTATRVYGTMNLLPLEQEDPELWEAINTYTHIGGNPDLVVRLIHGRDEDRHWYDVPPEVSVEFHDALAEAGYDVELTYVDGASHGALLDPSSEAFELTVRQAIETVHELTVTNSASVSEAMTLTFGSAECVYEGPSVVSAGPANLTFVNNSGATGAVNVIELLDDKTWEDLVDYAGEQPSSKHAPPWTRDVRQWRPIPSGETLLWEEELAPGTYAMVCANTSPLAVWLGSSFEVDG